MPGTAITARLVEKARAIGFDLCGVAAAEDCDDRGRLPEWLARGYAGEMHYLDDERRASVCGLWPGARSVIVCALNYNTARPYSTRALAEQENSSADRAPRGWISRYAWGGDYHAVLQPKLQELASWLRHELGRDFASRIYVDTGPVLERLAAKHAGLGWLAKNTCLINERLGSWLFLGVIVTDLDLAPAAAQGRQLPRDFCGTCTRCLDACPTGAFVAPYLLDARRCISYLTIELRGAIPEPLRPAMGAMIFGCDICQDVCPWNRQSPASAVSEFFPRETTADRPGAASLFMPALGWLLALSEEEFRAVFRRSPVKRTKWRGLLRNVCVALGNSSIKPEDRAYPGIIGRLEQLARAQDAVVAEHAGWALARLRSPGGATSPASRALPGPPENFVDHGEEK